VRNLEIALITYIVTKILMELYFHRIFRQGCTFIVIFGLPGDKHEDDPARALKAGHRILDALHQFMEIT